MKKRGAKEYMQEEILKTTDGWMLLPNNQYISMNDKDTKLNNNVLICGTSGSCKTRSIIVPNLLERIGSYIVTDPKGNLYKRYGKYMEHFGYRVIRLTLTKPHESFHYNPLEYIKNTTDVQKLTHGLITADKKINVSTDPFWDDMSIFLINSVIGYLFEISEDTPELNNIPMVLELLRNCGRPNSNSKECKYDTLMREHEKKYPNSWAVKQYKNVSQAPNKTYDTIVSNCLSKFSIYDTEELQELLSFEEIDIPRIGIEKTVLFVEISDTDNQMSNLINIFFTQAFNLLCSYADNRDDSRLPCPVRFMIDDFPTINIDNFEVIISNIRSRKISAVIVIQSLAQLNAAYGDSANTIMDNCDTFIFTGTNSPETAQMIALRANKTMDSILHMPINHSWIFRRGSKPFMCENLDLDTYMKDKHPIFDMITEIRRKNQVKSIE